MIIVFHGQMHVKKSFKYMCLNTSIRVCDLLHKCSFVLGNSTNGNADAERSKLCLVF